MRTIRQDQVPGHPPLASLQHLVSYSRHSMPYACFPFPRPIFGTVWFKISVHLLCRPLQTSQKGMQTGKECGEKVV